MDESFHRGSGSARRPRAGLFAAPWPPHCRAPDRPASPRNLRMLRTSPAFTACTNAIWAALGDDAGDGSS